MAVHRPSKAVVITAYNRPAYFQRVMHSWARATIPDDWDVIIRIEPGEFDDYQAQLAGLFIPKAKVIINPQVYGVLEHPYVAFSEAFTDGYQFVVRAEDDLLVSNDVLAFFDFAEQAVDNPRVLTANAYSRGPESGDPHAVHFLPDFNPWVWGTWRAKWFTTIGPTWDHDYSTFNDFPGNQSGWDWNLNTRIMPAQDLFTIAPQMSRVQNIGVHGVHGTAENLETAASYREEFNSGIFRTYD